MATPAIGTYALTATSRICSTKKFINKNAQLLQGIPF